MNPLEKLRIAAKAVREAIPEQRSWSTAESREGERLLEAGKFAEAEHCFVQLINSVKGRNNLRPQHGHALVCLAKAQFKQSKLRDAWITADGARELLSGGKLKPSTDLANAEDVLAGIKREEGNLDEAETHFRSALEAQKSVQPVDVPAILERSMGLVELLQQREQFDAAAEILEWALEQSEKGLGDVHSNTADCLIELGQCDSARGHHETARQHLERALAIHKELHGARAEIVVRDLQLLAVAAQGAGDLEAAVGYYEKALNIRDRQMGGSAAEVADILMDMAGVHSEMGRYGPAVELLQHAVSKLEGAREPNLGQALQKLGVVYMVSGRLPEAEASLRKARKLYEVDPVRHQSAIEVNDQMIAGLRAYYPAGPVQVARKSPEGGEREPIDASRPSRRRRRSSTEEETGEPGVLEGFDTPASPAPPSALSASQAEIWKAAMSSALSAPAAGANLLPLAASISEAGGVSAYYPVVTGDSVPGVPIQAGVPGQVGVPIQAGLPSQAGMPGIPIQAGFPSQPSLPVDGRAAQVVQVMEGFPAHWRMGVMAVGEGGWNIPGPETRLPGAMPGIGIPVSSLPPQFYPAGVVAEGGAGLAEPWLGSFQPVAIPSSFIPVMGGLTERNWDGPPAAAEPPASQQPKPLAGWDELTFEYVHRNVGVV